MSARTDYLFAPGPAATGLSSFTWSRSVGHIKHSFVDRVGKEFT